MGLSDDQVTEILTGIAKDVGEMKGKLNATIDAHNDRFEMIEQTAVENDRRQWIISAAVIPVVSALHYLANKMGIKV